MPRPTTAKIMILVGHPRSRAKIREIRMRLCTLALIGFALSLVGLVPAGRAQAAVAAAPNAIQKEADRLNFVEHAQYVYRGYRYCWYAAGWRGPGWYVCDYGPWVRGRWWGGPAGWRGWYWRGGRGPYWRGGPGPYRHGRRYWR